jgi:predicted lipoprotein with Yx(FWY)xxD motif
MKEVLGLRTLLLVGVVAVCVWLPASAATMLTAKNGMTVYVFDKDTSGVSACYDDCAKKWPPYLAHGVEKMGEGWATMKRKDGSMQWTYDDKPLYFYADDKKKGDANGDGVGSVWHIIKE